jgi:UDP-4-amino-4,6-dideoxy-N-acetyl-beta-L-altrosamine transaminase
MRDPIPYGRQDIDEHDIAAVVDVLRSDFLTQGPAVTAFESAVASYCGVDHAVAVNSATSALHLACLALGVGPGDRVWTAPNTFVASANCALYCGAEVDFVDIDPHSCNMSVACLGEKLHQASKAGELPKVVIPVHFAGEPCDMQAIAELAAEYGFAVIEDASHAIGARYCGDPVGNCRYSDITVFSFHPVKIVTSGEGGMALTRRRELAQRMELLRSHGITRDPQRMTHAPDGPWYYQQIALGFNYRMTDIHAALGLSQMRRLDEFVSRRNVLADRYDAAFGKLPLLLPRRDAGNRSSVHLYVIRIESPDGSGLRDRVFGAMRREGIGVAVHYIPAHTQPYFHAMGFAEGMFPEAERHYRSALSLPLFSSLDDARQDRVIGALAAALAS